MKPSYTTRLIQLGHTLRRWEAQISGSWILAAALAWLAVLSLVDVLMRVNRFGRAFCALGVVALLGYAVWKILKTLKKSYSAEAVAARVERTFPELDNHLINHLQFAMAQDNNPYKLAYLKQGEPKWQGLDFKQMRNRQAFRRSQGTLAGVLAIMLILWISLGSTWSMALWRMVNPFGDIEPVTLTNLVAVNPGDTTVLLGDALLIEAKAKGFMGHSVKIELSPEDGTRKTVELGSINDSKEQTFAHRVTRINAPLRYRVKAGDASFSDWFTVKTRPPPAFTGITMTTTPPAYTGKNSARFDALADEKMVYQGAAVDLDVECNTSLTSLQIVTVDGTALDMKAGENNRSWKGSVVIESGHAVTLRAVDVFDTKFEEQVTYQLIADRPPVLEIAAPRGRVQLPPGQAPHIEFSVVDDYGIESAEIQEVTGGGDGGKVLRSWPLNNKKTHAAGWTRASVLRPGSDVAYRVVVKDNCPFAEQKIRSLPLTFGAIKHSEAAKEQEQLEKKAVVGLHQIIEMQKTNVEQTESFLTSTNQVAVEEWEDPLQRQQKIRTLTREMLASPVRPFGGLTPTVKKLYVNEMSSVVDLMKGMPNSAEEKRAERGKEALQTQQAILKQLGYAKAEAASSAAKRRVSALSGMLTSMIREQENILKTTREFVSNGAEVGLSLVDAQDLLPEDLTAFRDAAKEEAEAVRGNDEAFAKTLDEIALKCESLKIRNQMILAAERLDENQPKAAMPFEEKAIASLKVLQEAMGEVALQKEEEKRTVLAEALSNAKEKLDRIQSLRRKMRESMDAIRGQEDQSDGIKDEEVEEAYQELVKNTQESILEIPTDLHTFADQLAANDLVEDVFQIFQEIEQVKGTEKGNQETKLSDFAKEDANLELMDEAIERIDELETWLLEKPDDKRVTAEAFDREEMPEDGVAKGELGDAVEDLIGELLDEDEDQQEEADDSASTHGVTDMETGHGVMEGETVTFSAKGKSGNRTPDHKEQDGRSNVGRQGMAVGETAAASGTISEGDKNIEERRTEDAVQGGKIDLDGEADTRATGGGKKGAGKADDYGMSGGVKRIDSSEQGSSEGMSALMAKKVDSIYAKASLKNIRVDSLKNAAHHLRQAEDAIAEGNIEQMKEFRRLAAVSLQKAQARLEAGPSGAVDSGSGSDILDDVVEGGSDMAPADYREEVADYYRALNEIL
jgi:hypothetical protein